MSDIPETKLERPNGRPRKHIKDETVSLPQISDKNQIKKMVAIRRSKVRELERLGYDARGISAILDKGVKLGSGEVIHIEHTVNVIKNDLEYLKQERLARDEDFITKREGVIDKLWYLYQRAMLDYAANPSTSKTRATFLNAALGILKEIADIEGLRTEQGNLNVAKSNETKLSQMAEDTRRLDEKARAILNSAISEVLERKQSEGTGEVSVLSEQPTVPALPSNNGGVPEQSRVHESRGQAKTA
jgi:hypothetical protein